MTLPHLPATFRAYEFEQHGNPLEVIRLNPSVPQPPLQPTEVRIRVHSAALNPVNLKIIEFGPKMKYPQTQGDPPYRIGFDVAGRVVEVGSDVTKFQAGEAVFGMAERGKAGSFAEFVNVDVKFLSRKPRNLSFNEAAGLALAGETSYQGIVDHGRVKAGDRVLILGGSSGTGVFAVQIAKARGAFVIATTSSRNVELVKSLGADQVIDYTREQWGDVLEAHSVDAIYDCGVEPESWNTQAQRVLVKGTGRFVSIIPIPDAIESPIGATAVPMYLDRNAEGLERLTELAENGQLVVPIDSVHLFENLLDAVCVQRSQRARGKVMLQVLSEPEPSN